MKKLMLGLGAALLTGAAWALPEISSVTFGTEDSSRPWAITVNYLLTGEAAVITFEVQTNGVPVEGVAYEHATGDVNHLYQPGSHSFVWQADLDWPGQNYSSSSVKIVVKAAPQDCPPDYMVIPICTGVTTVTTVLAAPAYYDKEADIPGEITDYRYKTEYLVMRKIHARGKMYRQGRMRVNYNDNVADDKDVTYSWERERLVAMTNDFYLAVYESTTWQIRRMCRTGVTLYTYAEACYKSNMTKYRDYVGNYTEPSMTRAVGGPTPKYYLMGVNYNWPEAGMTAEAGRMLATIRSCTGFPTMHLPMSYQWEYAARAGTNWDFYKPASEATNTFWYAGNNAEDPDWIEDFDLPHPVGMREPNAWGLYDMLGNVSEWCRDNPDYYRDSTSADTGGWPSIEPAGPSGSTVEYRKYLMGGNYKCDLKTKNSCWVSSALRSSWGENAPNYGFRLSCDAYAVR